MSFTFDLNKIRIDDNREFLLGAEVKFYSFVATSNRNFDLDFARLDGYTGINLAARSVSNHAKRLLSLDAFQIIENVQDGHVFQYGDTGKCLYRSEKTPQFFDWLLVGIEVDEDIREAGRYIDELVSSPKLDTAISAALLVAGAAINPAVTASVELGKIALGLVSECMTRNQDDQIGCLSQSFVKGKDYANGKRDAVDVPDATGNMFVDYSIWSDI